MMIGSVLNTFKSMVVGDDVLEKEDMYILDRMKEFISNEEVKNLAAAKQLMIFIERAVRTSVTDELYSPAYLSVTATRRECHKDDGDRPTNSTPAHHAEDIKLLDIDTLELARQLTIMESQLYQKIRPIECLQRAREQKADHNDNIAAVIQTSNRVCCVVRVRSTFPRWRFSDRGLGGWLDLEQRGFQTARRLRQAIY
jgi:son of sevenless-like protein